MSYFVKHGGIPQPVDSGHTRHTPDPAGIDVVTEQPVLKKEPPRQERGGWYNSELAD